MEGTLALETDLLSGLELAQPVCQRERLAVHNGRTPDGDEILVVCLEAGAPAASVESFQAMIQHGAIGGLSIQQADSRVILAQPPAAGTLAHLPVLDWRLERRLQAFQEVAKLVHNFHREDLLLGAMDPASILLDQDLHPFFLGPLFMERYGPYTAPDLERSGRVDRRAEVYSLGRLLHYIILQETPPLERDDPAELVSLVTYPAGLSRIIRRATRRSPKDRYASVAHLVDEVSRYGRYDEVGVVHPDIEEENLGGLSFRPPPFGFEPLEGEEQESQLILEKIAVDGLQNVEPFKLRASTRSLLVVLGLLCVFTAFGLNYLMGDPQWVRVALSLSAGLVGFALLSPGIERESRTRTIFSISFAAMMFAWNPTPYLAKFAESMGLRSELAVVREKNFRAQMKRGVVTFEAKNLADTNLKGKLFLATDLTSTTFEGADLTKARFFMTNLTGVRFSGAKLNGAIFQDTSVQNAIGFHQALCDAETKLPEAWSCVDLHPKYAGPADANAESKNEAKPLTPEEEAEKKAQEALKTPLFKGEESALDDGDSGFSPP